MSVDARFIGGPWDGEFVGLEHGPAKIHVVTAVTPCWHAPNAKPLPGLCAAPPVCHIYDRLEDPDTGEYLGGYVYVGTATYRPLT